MSDNKMCSAATADRYEEDLTKLRTSLASQAAQIERWKKALYSVTPGIGSECIDDPEFCVKRIMDSRDTRQSLLIKQVAARREAEETLASQAAKIEAVRGLIESEGECTWCGWPFKNGIHAYDCAAATTFNLPEGEVVDNSYAKLRTRKGFVLAALES